MPEEKPENTDAKSNKLKAVDVQTLEAVIAKAISELLRAEYNCEMNNISYSSSARDWVGADGAKFEVNLWKNIWRKD